MTTVDWHGFSGWQMENDHVRVVIVPQLGAKIASLVDKTADHEWLSSPTNPLRERQYADRFKDHDLSGWDETFPTINVCASPHDAMIQLPDHGEVWALAWYVVEQGENSITVQVKGRSIDYTLTRKATLHSNTLRLEYTVDNNSDKVLPFLWAAHPLFSGDEHTRIVLPESVQEVVNVADHSRLGAPNTVLQWNNAMLLDGSQKQLDRVGSATLNDYRKIYLLPDQPVNTAALHQINIERELRLRWDSRVAPYLGIWVDEGTYTHTTTIALEPTTGYYDSLALAIENERVATVAVGASVSWWMEVEVKEVRA